MKFKLRKFSFICLLLPHLTLVEEVLRTSVGNVPWRYIEDHVEMSVGRRLETSSGRPRDVIVQGG